MKKSIGVLAAFVLSISLHAKVSNVSIVQNDASAKVSITYNLESDAIVTLSVATNGVTLGSSCLKRLVGDVNRMVRAGEGKTIHWFPAKSFPGNLIADGSLSASITLWSPDSPPDYLVCDLTVTNGVSYYVDADALPYDVTNNLYKMSSYVMRRIHATGRPWRMGSPVQGETGDTDESRTTVTVTHNVVLTNDYYIGVFPVTQKQYWFMTGGSLDGGVDNAHFKSTADAFVCPMENVSYESLRGTDWPKSGRTVSGSLLKIRALTGLALDLPTEAQWEFACRAGTGTAYNNGKNCTTAKDGNAACPNLAEVGWYGGNKNQNFYGNAKDGNTYEVGLLAPNAWGLYDMHGNVFELCLDWYSEGAAYTGTFADGWENGVPTLEPVGAENGTLRVGRGGSYFYSPLRARSCYRSSVEPGTESSHYGFRFVCVIGE